jgi:hypothetical protein
MLELITSYSMSQVPYLTYEALDEYAEDLIRDFSPDRLETPGVFDIDGFLEYYLKLNIDFRRVHYEKLILGITAFSDGTIDVMNVDADIPEPMLFKKGTVLLDTSLSLKRNNHRRRFTMAHEGSHWLIHRKALAPDNPFGNIGAFQNQYLAAKTGKIDYSRSTKERNDVERMERQADFLGAAILMSRPSLRVAYRNFFLSVNEKPRILNKGGNNPADDIFAKELSKYVSELYNVSKRSALIRLEKLGAIVGKQ